MRCPNCDFENDEGYTYCARCGAMRPDASAPQSFETRPVDNLVAPPPPPEGMYQDVDAGAPKKDNKKTIGIVIGAVVAGLVVLVVLAAAVVLLFFGIGPIKPLLNLGGGGTNDMLLGVPVRSSESDLYDLKFGSDLAKAEPFLDKAGSPGWAYSSIVYLNDGDFDWLGSGYYSFGGFIPGTKYIIIAYEDDDTYYYMRKTVGKDDPVALFETEYNTSVYVLDKGETFVFIEYRGSRTDCYVSKDGKEAARIAKGDDCVLSRNGKTLMAAESNSKNEMTLTAYDLDGGNEIELLNDEPDVEYYYISGDGSRVAYLQNDDGEKQATLLDRASGDVLVESDKTTGTLEMGFAMNGSAFYLISEDEEEGILELFTMDGGLTSINTGYSIGADFNMAGTILVYSVSDEDGNVSVYSHSMSGGDDVLLMDGGDLTFALIADPAYVMIKEIEDNETTLYSVPIGGGDAVELFNEEDIYYLDIYYVPGSNNLFLSVSADAGDAIFVTPINDDTGRYIVEEWAEASILNLSENGKTLLFKGREDNGDDITLMVVDIVDKRAEPVELETRVDDILDAFFGPSGKTVVYTAETGSDYDEVEVREVPITGEEKPTTLYSEAYLVDVGWTRSWPFKYAFFNYPSQGSSYCPGAPKLEVGATLDGTIDPDIGSECYRIKLDADTMYTVMADSTDELWLELYDKEGYYVTSSNSGYTPSMRANVDTAGTYYVQVYSWAYDSTDFSISLEEGISSPEFDNATVIYPGSPAVSGAITSSDSVYISEYDWATYGDMYYFDVQSGDEIVLEIWARRIGSDIDPYIILFGPDLTIVEENDDGAGSLDSYLSYNAYAAGRYYVLIRSLGDYTGTSSTAFYELDLSLR